MDNEARTMVMPQDVRTPSRAVRNGRMNDFMHRACDLRPRRPHVSFGSRRLGGASGWFPFCFDGNVRMCWPECDKKYCTAQRGGKKWSVVVMSQGTQVQCGRLTKFSSRAATRSNSLCICGRERGVASEVVCESNSSTLRIF
jgi:hypothetical protein